VRVDVIQEMMLQRSDECAFRTCHQLHPCDSLHSCALEELWWKNRPTLVILPIHGRLRSFGGSIPAVRTTVLFERLQVTLEHDEVRTSIGAQG